MTEQRRLAAIVSADVAGYSRLMGRDESGTLAALKAIRQEVVDPAIASHGGRIVKTTGDGLLLEFPSVVNAVRCAVEVQTAMADRTAGIAEDRRIAFRIGINIGDIIVEGDDIFGDGVNVAARLQEIAAPGGICISSRVHDDVRDRLDTAFDDGGTQTLKNIARPVQVWRWQPGTTVAPKPAPAPTALPLPDKPSIAVLPFQNMSGDPEQEYFADGMVEDIITSLSRFKSLFVIARNSSFSYKGKSPDIRQVGKELGVRYVLEGSVRKAGGRMRITGQLIEAATGAHLWADKFDGALEDVFDLQDKITSNVVGAVAPAMQVAETERSKRKPTGDLDAYDFFLRGSAVLWEGRIQDAIGYFKKAIEKDDRYAEAYGVCAGTYVVLQTYGGIAISPEERAEALRFADMAANLGTDDALALARAAQALVFFGKEYERGLAMIDRAIGLNPNLSTVWLIRGWINYMSSEIEEARNSFLRVLQFSERDPARIGACCGISWCCFYLGKYEEGCTWAAKALQKYANALYLLPLIMNATRAGRKDEARAATDRLLQMVPGFRVSSVLTNRKAEFEADAADALRYAGLQ